MNLLWTYSHFLSAVQLFLCRFVQLLLKFHFRDCSVRSGNTRYIYIVDKNKFAAYVISFSSEGLAEPGLKNNKTVKKVFPLLRVEQPYIYICSSLW